MIFQRGQHVLFIGDSITDCGRRDVAAPYGDGYVSLVRAFTVADHPDLALTWTNRGVGGDTVRELRDRWKRDVDALRPDWLSVMIGINDVWRAFGDEPDDAVPLDEFTSTLRKLLRSAAGCRLILADPYIIELDRSDPQRAMSDRYAAAVGELARELDALHVPTQAAFDRVLASTTPADWAHDRIHPNLPGHAVIARAFLDVIG